MFNTSYQTHPAFGVFFAARHNLRRAIMATDPKTLFTSLAAGDMLMVPIRSPLIDKKEKTCLVTVLRVDDQGGLYLSRFSDDHPVPTANAPYNPYSWSDDSGTLVDCDGDVPRWYTTDITLERGGAKKAAAEYADVPRTEHLRHELTEADMKAFRSDPRYQMISGISQNGEAGNPANQLSLVLDLMGVAHTKEQLVGVAWHLLHTVAKSDVQIALISLDSGSIADAAEGNPPNHEETL
jgi:hypothetical protein